MVEELIGEDGMCVMSAGMGWQKAVAVILRLHMERRRSVRLVFHQLLLLSAAKTGRFVMRAYLLPCLQGRITRRSSISAWLHRLAAQHALP